MKPSSPQDVKQCIQKKRKRGGKNHRKGAAFEKKIWTMGQRWTSTGEENCVKKLIQFLQNSDSGDCAVARIPAIEDMRHLPTLTERMGLIPWLKDRPEFTVSNGVVKLSIELMNAFEQIRGRV